MTKQQAINVMEKYTDEDAGISKVVIEAHNMAIAALKSQRWIPVDEQLPELGIEVLAYIRHNYMDDGWRAYRVYEYTDHWVGMGNLCDVIAWIPLPKPFVPQTEI